MSDVLDITDAMSIFVDCLLHNSFECEIRQRQAKQARRSTRQIKFAGQCRRAKGLTRRATCGFRFTNKGTPGPLVVEAHHHGRKSCRCCSWGDDVAIGGADELEGVKGGAKDKPDTAIDSAPPMQAPASENESVKAKTDETPPRHNAAAAAVYRSSQYVRDVLAGSSSATGRRG